MTTDTTGLSGAPAPLTLTDDLNSLSASDLEGVVTRACSVYGTVLKVVVHLSHAHLNARAFALVDMSLPEEAERLAAAFNRHRMGAAVLLLLQPRPAF